jgi:hypothetical protein
LIDHAEGRKLGELIRNWLAIWLEISRPWRA